MLDICTSITGVSIEDIASEIDTEVCEYPPAFNRI